MGYTIEHGTWDLHVRALRLLDKPIPELRVAELGSQEIKKDVFGRVFPARDYWLKHGAKQHVSFDLNGKYDAMILDLGMPMPRSQWDRFDLVTNYGTSEHVETSQYWCWRNTHELARNDTGLIVHAVPMVGSWEKHCKIWYTERWLEALGEACNYNIAHVDYWGKHPWLMCRAIFLKTQTERDKSMTPAQFEELFDEAGCIDRT